MRIFLFLALAVAVYLAVSVYASRTQKPVRTSLPIANDLPSLASGVGATLTISTWNLGYAGLGADSDFVADGGDSLLPPSRKSTRRNLAGIVEQVAKLDSDIALYQEVADSSPLSYWAPLDAKLRAANVDRVYLFQRDVASRLFVWPLRVRHGIVTASRVRPVSAETVPLPLDPVPLMGIINRLYALQVTRYADADGGPEWTVVNLHLSAFDETGLRERQLRAAIGFAQAEYSAGRRVVLGGDWNLALVDHPLSPADAGILFWLRAFPREVLPAGWNIVAPQTAPTVRAVHKAYVPGENPTATIDGFVTSPNVRTISIEAVGTDFRMSDHQPVIARFAAQ